MLAGRFLSSCDDRRDELIRQFGKSCAIVVTAGEQSATPSRASLWLIGTGHVQRQDSSLCARVPLPAGDGDHRRTWPLCNTPQNSENLLNDDDDEDPPR